jgi:uncharacterized protein YwlG (UPF0340 family)
MISKLFKKKNSQEIFQIMFQICVLDQNVQGKYLALQSWKHFLNAMIRNIKIYNILDIIEISNVVELNKCTHLEIFMKIFI